MVTLYQNNKGFSRRDLLKRAATGGAVMAFVFTGNALISADRAWGMETSALKPETMATLIQMARDIYPHDSIPDKFYAIAVKGYDDPAKAEMVEAAIADINAKSGANGYLGLGWEDDRVAVLRQVESTDFFKTVRGGLVTGFYNQQDVWPYFGYEGESYSKGGYIDRGFDDIEWL